MAKYLPRFADWDAIILSVKREFHRTDSSLMDEVPRNTLIYRVRSWEPLTWLEGWHQKNNPLPGNKISRSNAGERSKPVQGVSKGSLIANTRKSLVKLLTIPDRQAGWIPHAVLAGLQIVRRHEPDVILATAPPWSALIIGSILASLTGVPWVADYRDPWTFIEFRGKTSRPGLESHILRNAAAVISSSDHYTNAMRQRFSERPASDFVTVFNGFDEAKISTSRPSPADYFTISHLGSLYPFFDPEPLFIGLRDWLALNQTRRSRTKLQFIGRISASLREMLSRLSLLDVTVELGYLPHAEAIATCQRSHVLLLAMGVSPLTPVGWMPSKLYEYLAFQRPILAYTVNGEAAETIRQADAGEVVSSTDTGEVVAALERLYCLSQSPHKCEETTLPPAIRRFTQAEIIPALALILDRVSRSSQSL